jgi:hypothetical protein
MDNTSVICTDCIDRKGRHNIYIEALHTYEESIENREDLSGLCHYIAMAFLHIVCNTPCPHPVSLCIAYDFDIKYFPEIYRYKPEWVPPCYNSILWWGRKRTKRRLSILRNAIRETEEKP